MMETIDGHFDLLSPFGTAGNFRELSLCGAELPHRFVGGLINFTSRQTAGDEMITGIICDDLTAVLGHHNLLLNPSST